MRQSRSVRIPSGQAGCYHLISRCTRRAFLLAEDGRKSWIEEQISAWCQVLCLDRMAYAIMDNHVHIVVRLRPDLVRSMSDVQVVRRFCAANNMVDWLPTPLQAYSHQYCADRLHLLDQARAVLAHPGAMMRAIKEGSARLINREDGTSGHAWESRCHDVALLDAGAVLACMIYVDLNPVRAGICVDVAKSPYCSAARRCRPHEPIPAPMWGCHDHPVLDEAGAAMGSLRVSAAQYAELLQASADGIVHGDTQVPDWAEHVLARCGVVAERWIDCMRAPGRMTGRAIGTTAARRALSGKRLICDKTGLFAPATE